VLYSQFFIGDDHYVIAINQIAAIVPFVNLKTVPSLPDYAAGLLGFHGNSVPVIDLCRLFNNRPCDRKLSSRIILVKIRIKPECERMIGLLVERATETYSADDDEFVDPGMCNPDLPFVGPIINDDIGVITKILPQRIFEKIDENLFFPGDMTAVENQ
jgi:chemotaxis-related protein WspB